MFNNETKKQDLPQEKTVIDAVIDLRAELTLKNCHHTSAEDETIKCGPSGYLAMKRRNIGHVCTIEEFNQCVREMAEAKWMSKNGVGFDYQVHKDDEFDAKKAEPIYTQAMKDAGDDIEIGMLYIDEDGHQCSLIGENNSPCVYVGRPTDNRINPRYISVSDKDYCKPIDTRTPEEEQVEEISALLSKSCLTTHVECVKLLQQKGLLAEIK
jgi:hypothetical protein